MEESIGLLAVPAPSKGGIAGWWQGSQALRLLKRTGKPVLLARGNHPYRRIVLPVRRTAAGKVAAWTAIDLARATQVPIHGIAVVDPVFNAGPDAEVVARYDLTWLEDEAAVQDVHVEDSIVRGNPVRVFLDNAEEGDLLVLALRSEAWRPWPRLRVGPLLARLSKVSVLLVPTRDLD
jgi:nucleotide-binding universal stress UspA family protein